MSNSPTERKGSEMEQQVEQTCGAYIETFTGKKFYYDERMSKSQICIEDIAHALAIEPRFGGHSRVPYSVAEHCCYAFDEVRRRVHGYGIALAALLHDAHEAYTKDLMKPLRMSKWLEGYMALAERVQAIIEERYSIANLSACDRGLIKKIDIALLRIESAALMPSAGQEWVWPSKESQLSIYPVILNCWDWKTAKREFLDRFSRCW